MVEFLKVASALLFVLALVFGYLVWEETHGIDVHHSASAATAARAAAAATGRWGAVTATVNWCEADYVWTSHVAELFNALSSLSLVFVGCFGVVEAARRMCEKKWLLAYTLVVVVGVGSLAFHATLQRTAQFADELPMNYLFLCFIYIAVEDTDVPRYPWLPCTLLAAAALVTALSLLASSPVFFHVSFAALLLAWICTSVINYRATSSSTARTLIEVSWTLFILAAFAWLVEPRVCDSAGWLQLHAWWHVLCAVALHLWLLFQQYTLLAKRKQSVPAVRPHSACCPLPIVVDEKKTLPTAFNYV